LKALQEGELTGYKLTDFPCFLVLIGIAIKNGFPLPDVALPLTSQSKKIRGFKPSTIFL
jgi:hypothetical protein